MKKVIAIFFMVFACLSLSAQNHESKTSKPELGFSRSEHDFGTISEKGKVSYGFEIQNKGGSPLVITKTMVSCKCISIDYPKKPLAPGAKGKITVTYNPKKQHGVFYKAIQVYSNDPAGRHVITVKGKVQD